MSYIYIVTRYGCNSGGTMWTPQSKTFTEHDAAYAHFLTVSPPLNDPDNRAEKYTNEEYAEQRKVNQEYIVIETREQVAGYLDGDATCAKRPYGAVFAAIKLALFLPNVLGAEEPDKVSHVHGHE